jgi:hypothetical protein
MDLEFLFLSFFVAGIVVYVVFMVNERRGIRGKEAGKTEPKLEPLRLDEIINTLETNIKSLETRMGSNEKKIGEFKVALDLEPPSETTKTNLRVFGERLTKVEEIVTKLVQKEPEQEKQPTGEKAGEKQGEPNE